jgi:hypothetical protein
MASQAQAPGGVFIIPSDKVMPFTNWRGEKVPGVGVCIATNASTFAEIANVIPEEFNSVMTVVPGGLQVGELPKGIVEAGLGLTFEHNDTKYSVVSIGLQEYVEKACETYCTHMFGGRPVHAAAHTEVMVTDSNGVQKTMRQQPAGRRDTFWTMGGNASPEDFTGNNTLFLALAVCLLREIYEESCTRKGQSPILTFEEFISRMGGKKIVFTTICVRDARTVNIGGCDFEWPKDTQDVHYTAMVFMPADLAQLIVDNFSPNDEVSAVRMQPLPEELTVGRAVVDIGTGGWTGLPFNCHEGEQPNGGESVIVRDIPQFSDILDEFDADADDDMMASQQW